MATRAELITEMEDTLNGILNPAQEAAGAYMAGRMISRLASLEGTYPLHLTDAAQGANYLAGAQEALGAAVSEIFEANDWRPEFLGAIADGILLHGGDGFDPHEAVRVVTSADITLSGFQTIDGISLGDGDRVAALFQTDAEDNGIWIVRSGAWERAPDMDLSGELVRNSFFAVLEGTLGEGTSWICTTPNPITLGVTETAWVLYQSSISVSGGDGLVRVGNILHVGAGTGIQVNADSVQISPTYAGQGSIVTVGTIASGGWQGSPVAAAYGGTGQASYATGDLLYASGATALSRLAANATGTRQFLTSVSAGIPAWSVLADADIPATLVRTSRTISTTSPLSGGGDLSANRTLTVGGLSSLGASNQIVGVNAAASAWEYKSMAGTANRLSVTPAAGSYSFDISANYIGQSSITTVGTITNGIWNGSAIGTGFGGTGHSSYTLGDLLYASGTSTLSRLTGNILTSRRFLAQTGSGSASAAPIWSAISAADVPSANLLGTTNQVNLSASGTGVLLGGTSITLSLPQNIHTAAVPTFAGATLNGRLDLYAGTGSGSRTDHAEFYTNATEGLLILPRAGSSYQFRMINSAGNMIMETAAATPGSLTLGGSLIVSDSQGVYSSISATLRRMIGRSGTQINFGDASGWSEAFYSIASGEHTFRIGGSPYLSVAANLATFTGSIVQNAATVGIAYDLDNSTGNHGIRIRSGNNEVSDGTERILQLLSGTSGNNVFSAHAGGLVEVRAGDFQVLRSASGFDVFGLFQNSSNTANSHAVVQIQNGGASGGMAYARFVGNTTNWSFGALADGTFQFNRQNGPGGSSIFSVDSSRNVSFAAGVTVSGTLLANSSIRIAGGTGSGVWTAYGEMWSSATDGLVIIGRAGSSTSFVLARGSDGVSILDNPSGSLNTRFYGTLEVLDNQGILSRISSTPATMIGRTGNSIVLGDSVGWTSMQSSLASGNYSWRIGSSPVTYMTLSQSLLLVTGDIRVQDTIANQPTLDATTTNAPSAFGVEGGRLALGLESRRASIRSVVLTNIGSETWASSPRVGLTFHTTNPGGAEVEAMRILDNRNVLINRTADSGHRFQVTGTAEITGNLTVVGNINFTNASGTWNGVTIGPAYGGTGHSNYAVGDLLYASGVSTLSRLAANPNAQRRFLTSQNSTAPAWSALVDADIPSTLVRTSRTISTQAPITGGGNLSSDRTFSIGGLTSFGSANQLPGTNSAGTAWEYKTIQGSANRVTVTHGAGSITISAPQNIHTGASPTFAEISISGLNANGFMYPNAGGSLTSTAAATNGQILIGRTGLAPVAGAITGTANRITVTLGAGTIALTTPQDIHTGAAPTFSGATLSGLAAGFAGHRLVTVDSSGTLFSMVSEERIPYFASSSGGITTNANLAYSNATSTFSTANINLSGTFTGAGDWIYTQSIHAIRTNTSAGADNRRIYISGAGGVSSSLGGYVHVAGNQASGQPGMVQIVAGNIPGGDVQVHTGGNQRIRVEQDGDFFYSGNFFGVGPAIGSAGSEILRVGKDSVSTIAVLRGNAGGNNNLVVLNLQHTNTPSAGQTGQSLDHYYDISGFVSGVEAPRRAAIVRVGKEADFMSAGSINSYYAIYTTGGNVQNLGIYQNRNANVAIGHTVPTAKLDVNGDINAGGSFDNPGGWNRTIRVSGASHSRVRAVETTNGSDAYIFADRTVGGSNPWSGVGTDLSGAATFGVRVYGTWGSVWDSFGFMGLGTGQPSQWMGGYGVPGGAGQSFLHVKGTNSALGIQGSAYADIWLGDSGAAANQKWMVIRTDGGQTDFMPHSDAGGILSQPITIRHSDAVFRFGGKITNSFSYINAMINAEASGTPYFQANDGGTVNVRFAPGGHGNPYNYFRRIVVMGPEDVTGIAPLDVRQGDSTSVIAAFGAAASVHSTFPGYIYISNVNTMNAGYGLASDNAAMWINYRGYNNGGSYYRDLAIGNGRESLLAIFRGQDGRVGILRNTPMYTLDVGGTFGVSGNALFEGSEFTFSPGGSSTTGIYANSSEVRIRSNTRILRALNIDFFGRFPKHITTGFNPDSVNVSGITRLVITQDAGTSGYVLNLTGATDGQLLAIFNLSGESCQINGVHPCVGSTNCLLLIYDGATAFWRRVF